MAINQAQTMLHAANGNGGGSINVFNSSFAPVTLSLGAFATPAAISAKGLVPFNVQDIGGSVYVTYAPTGHAAQTIATARQGAVAVFNESGVLQSMTVGAVLASPWGVALAPAGFGQFGGDLLVGNFSFKDSIIDAFSPKNGAFDGTVAVDPGAGDMPSGLWSLEFGSGGSGSSDTLYFTDGINGEADGLFGAISVSEPSTWAMMLVGLGGLGLLAERRRRQSLAIGSSPQST